MGVKFHSEYVGRSIFFSSLSDAHFVVHVTFAIVSSDFDFELFEWYGEYAW